MQTAPVIMASQQPTFNELLHTLIEDVLTGELDKAQRTARLMKIQMEAPVLLAVLLAGI